MTASDAPLAVFDVDGTLVDSRSSIHIGACEAAKVLGLPEPSYDRVRQIVGLTLDKALHTLEPQLTMGELAEFVAAFQKSFRDRYEAGHEEPLYDGVMPTLRHLKKDGWKLAIATGQNSRGVARNMARPEWSELFTSAHCASDGPGKPDPSMLLAAVYRNGATLERTVMIGDTSHDMLMAKNAKVTGQGVGWGFHTVEEQLAAGAVHVANDFSDLEAALNRFAAKV
ncbi:MULTISPECIES: HAD-IA family hydrolase [unclassified Brevundimonas]|uniref:HAD-IA family hydrolase n=1 Tax=unclassified Brevundimonas TaxID=2622653 RepID=UPI0025BE767E|nr:MULTISPECIES: HAD-IA family hydrolase [unclassified Brevundimonas]